ncbi:acyl-CoA dehydrogenase family protein [Pseudonocardia aurantiaca]|uniref:Acyl-CoA dehydrogenase family protein n=1 Tax=Pseudonocardia aurantiaca TaxID=75290 RepID=A0ABW4FQ75_9PSEU
MDFSLTEEQHAAQSVAAEVFAPRSAGIVGAPAPPSGAAWFDREAWGEAAAGNLLGLAVAEDVGGTGLGLLETCTLLEMQGRHLARLPMAITLAVAAPAIDAFGPARLRESILPAMVSGDSVLSAALVEPHSHDPLTVSTIAKDLGEAGWQLDGEKICVPFAEHAEHILVPAETAENEVKVFLVEATADGVVLEGEQTTSGQPESRMVLTGVRVAADAVLAGPEGVDVLRWMVDRAVVATCAIQLGVAEQALRMTSAYTSEREQFGRPIAMFQAVALRAANAYLDVECIRSTLWQAAWALDNDRPVGHTVDVAKFWASEGGQRVTAAAQQLHGGMGVDTDYPLHRYTLWSKHNELSLGAGHSHLASIGAAMAWGSAERNN